MNSCFGVEKLNVQVVHTLWSYNIAFKLIAHVYITKSDGVENMTRKIDKPLKWERMNDIVDMCKVAAANH